MNKSIVDLEEELANAMNLAIAEELIREISPNVTEEKIKEVWIQCNGNPWNAGILYKLLELKK